MRPLDPLSSIKTKLGVIIAGALGAALLVVGVGLKLGAQLAVVGIVSGIVGLAMVQFLARGMTSPLRQMARAAQAMSKGDYSATVVASSRDEVGELARAFNAMAAELKEIDRVRRDLVANVSHELRTPISGLQAVLENLVDGVEPPDTATLRRVLKQVERLGRLVEQLLDLSKLESGAVPLSTRPFDVYDVIDEVVAESRIVSGTVDLDFRVEPKDLQAEGDPERIHQVVANLLDNALRHSPAEGKVEVNARGLDGTVRIEVVDEGPGIPESEAGRVFERFYRSDLSRSSAAGGSGLGLAIARWIVDLHGGEIRAEQNEPHGCRMVLTLRRVS